jgi:rhodanese-related sulfurtransferase
MPITENNDIRVEELKSKMDSGENFVFIDVREVYEYRQFNLGADLIPLAEIQGHIPNLLKQKDNEIIIHCLSGKRSETAKQILLNAGCTNVRNVLGGVLDWIDKFGPSAKQ